MVKTRWLRTHILSTTSTSPNSTAPILASNSMVTLTKDSGKVSLIRIPHSSSPQPNRWASSRNRTISNSRNSFPRWTSYKSSSTTLLVLRRQVSSSHSTQSIHTFMNAPSITGAPDSCKRDCRIRDCQKTSCKDIALAFSTAYRSTSVKFLATKVETTSCRSSCRFAQIITDLSWRRSRASSLASQSTKTDAE